MRQKFKMVSAAALYGEQDAHEQMGRPLTTRQAACLFITEEIQRTAWEQAALTHPLAADAGVADLYALIQGFCGLIRERRGTAFDAWTAQVQERVPAELRAFVQGLLKDEAAVRAGLTLPYSQGQTEVQVNRL